jgi:hypothetical protein
MTNRLSKKRKSKASKIRNYAFLGCVLLLALAFLTHDDLVFSENMLLSVAHEDSFKNSHASSKTFELAYHQSLGFFDDVTNENWRHAQEIHSKMFPNHAPDLLKYSNPVIIKDKTADVKHSNFWNAQNFQEEFHCAYAQRLPTAGGGDGPKWVCDPHRFRNKKDCLVYSIGSNGKAEFERGVKDDIGDHCEIHTFDFNNYNRRNGHFDKALEGLATFHHWGLGTEDQARNRPQMFKTLSQTMQELGHTNRTIDLFKIDCECCEWFTFRTWLKHDLRQILVETHNAPMPNARDFFYALHDAGYVIFNKEANYQNQGKGVEYGFLKLSTDFFINGSTYEKLQ